MVLAIGLGFYAIYLPIALFVHRDYIQMQRPVGDDVEMMQRLDHDKPDHYMVRSYLFTVARYPDASKITVYENMTPLPRENFNFVPDIGVYVIRFKASDGSDPRTNGRQYWTVGKR